MKYCKLVSGKGKVFLSESEVNKLFENDHPIEEPTDEITELKNQMNAVSRVMQKLCSNDFVASLLLKEEGGEGKNGH